NSQKFCCWEIEEQDGSCEEWIDWSSHYVIRWFCYVVFSTLFATICAYMIRSYAPYAAGSGISEIKCILAGFVMKGFLGGRTLLFKSVCLPLAIASGLSVGKEGPSVHTAACVGNVVSRLFGKYTRNKAKMREILSASCAAGVAVAFGSPIGGVLFSFEVNSFF
ncbi:22006_t:CDS:2, partial [Dentiscutata erythropus]